MAHFAELDENNRVLRVIVINNAECLDDQGQEREALGAAFCARSFGGQRWVQTSYNARFRKNYAGNGYTYDTVRDAFIAPQPFPSWVLDEATCRWMAPIPYPENPDNLYVWSEEDMGWIQADPDPLNPADSGFLAASGISSAMLPTTEEVSVSAPVGQP